MNIQQISEELNFANQSFFGNYFKHYTGMSPKEYKKNKNHSTQTLLQQHTFGVEWDFIYP
jgi:AraC-like DNA-binding protein